MSGGGISTTDALTLATAIPGIFTATTLGLPSMADPAPHSTGLRIDPAQFDTVDVDISCRGG